MILKLYVAMAASGFAYGLVEPWTRPEGRHALGVIWYFLTH